MAATDQGIQLRVVSALSDGNKTVIYLEARDLEQERLGAQTTFQTLWVDRPEAAYVGGTFSSGQTVSYDAETHTALMRFTFTGDGPRPAAARWSWGSGASRRLCGWRRAPCLRSC